MQVMLMRLMSKGEYVIVPKGTKFTGSDKLGLILAIYVRKGELQKLSTPNEMTLCTGSMESCHIEVRSVLTELIKMKM